MGRSKCTMTGGTVADDAKRLTYCKADQLAFVEIMAVGTGIMHLRISQINQWWRIIVATGALALANLHDGCMIN